MRARFLRPAEVEVAEAADYLDAQRAGLGERFEREVEDGVSYALRYPLTGKVIGGAVRQRRLVTFRYNVIYMIDGEELIVVAVAHHRRRPGFWQHRLAPLR